MDTTSLQQQLLNTRTQHLHVRSPAFLPLPHQGSECTWKRLCNEFPATLSQRTTPASAWLLHCACLENSLQAKSTSKCLQHHLHLGPATNCQRTIPANACPKTDVSIKQTITATQASISQGKWRCKITAKTRSAPPPAFAMQHTYASFLQTVSSIGEQLMLGIALQFHTANFPSNIGVPTLVTMSAVAGIFISKIFQQKSQAIFTSKR